MEPDAERNKQWKLKKVNKSWFLDVSGKLKRMDILNNVFDVHMEDNVIFADDLVFQLNEESDGEVTVTEIKNICQRNKTSEYESEVTNVKNKTIVESRTSNDAAKDSLQRGGDQNEDTTQDVSLPHRYSSSRSKLTLVDDMDYLHNEEEDTLSDSDQEKSYEFGSEDYVPKKGVIRGFFKRIKIIVKKKPVSKQGKEPLYDEFSGKCKGFIPGNRDSGRVDNEEHEYDYTLFEPIKAQRVSSDAVPGARIVTAIFDFNQFSEDEISFQKKDKLKLRQETLSGISEWCFAEDMTTGKTGYIPLAYVTEDVRALEAQNWWHDVSRKGAEELFRMSDGSIGTYLIRPSDRGRMLVLSMLAPETDSSRTRIAHVKLKSHNRQLYIDLRRRFFDIFEFVQFYKSTAECLPCVLKRPVPRPNPVLYPRTLDIERDSVTIIRSVKVAEYGELFTGKLFNTFDITVVTKCNLGVDHFLAEAKTLYRFRQSKHFVRMLAVVIKPEPFMIILGETIRYTLQTYLKRDRGNTITFKSLTEMAAEIADGMAYLEEERFIHKELKSENVFVCALHELKIVHPKLSGLMKASDNDEHLKGEHEWQWTAPEAIADEDNFSTKSDVWSFGVLLYELITFGEVPYTGLDEEDTISRLHEGFRLSEPKDGPIQYPVAFYVTMLKCWHRRPECRPTFDFLGEFLHDFDVAIESETRLDNAEIQELYKKGTLQNERALIEVKDDIDMHTCVNIRTIVKPGKQTDSQKHDQTSGRTTQTPLRNNTEKPKLTGGFDAKVLYDYKAEKDYEISIYTDDIITNVDQIDAGWWKGTAANGTRGMFPSNFVEILDNAYAEKNLLRNKIEMPKITGGFDVKVLCDYEAEEDGDISIYKDDIVTYVEPKTEWQWTGTAANGARGTFPSNCVEIFENAYAEVTKL